jgi:hypothetical protein
LKNNFIKHKYDTFCRNNGTMLPLLVTGSRKRRSEKIKKQFRMVITLDGHLPFSAVTVAGPMVGT